MEITQGCVLLQLQLQKACMPPSRLIVIRSQLQMRQAFATSTNSRNRKIWNMCSSFLCYNILVYSFQTIVLFRHWNEGSNMEKLCVGALYLGISAITLLGLETMQQRGDDLISCEIECLKLAEFKFHLRSSLGKLGSLKETLVYVVVGGFYLGFEISVLAASFYLDYIPVKLTGKFLIDLALPNINTSLSVFWNVFVSLIACAYNTITVVYAGGNTIFLLLGITALCESINNLSLKLFPRMPHSGGTLEIKNSSFTKCLEVYRTVQIQIREVCQVTAEFNQNLIVMGVLSAACSGYACIKLSSGLALIVYVPLSLVLPTAVVINFLLIALTSVPNQNGTRFQLFWKRRLTRKENRLQLVSCPPIGYSYGFMETLQMKTALTIADVILNLVASLTLLQ